ncbi:hypothetical protein FKM82_008192 [Ascaphus truei]
MAGVHRLEGARFSGGGGRSAYRGLFPKAFKQNAGGPHEASVSSLALPPMAHRHCNMMSHDPTTSFDARDKVRGGEVHEFLALTVWLSKILRPVCE